MTSKTLVALVALSLSGCALVDAPTPAERRRLHDADAGRTVAQNQCQACHRLDGPVLDDAPPPLTEIARRYRHRRLDWELEAVSEVGHYRMPRRSLSSQEIADLAAYIQSLDKGQSADGPVGKSSIVR